MAVAYLKHRPVSNGQCMFTRGVKLCIAYVRFHCINDRYWTSDPSEPETSGKHFTESVEPNNAPNVL